MGRTIKLSEFKEQRRAESAIEIIGEDGESFIIEPPELWPDEAQTLAASGDSIGLCRLVLGGDEAYARFVAAGGTAALLGQIFQESLGTSPGKSQASSSS